MLASSLKSRETISRGGGARLKKPQEDQGCGWGGRWLLKKNVINKTKGRYYPILDYLGYYCHYYYL